MTRTRPADYLPPFCAVRRDRAERPPEGANRGRRPRRGRAGRLACAIRLGQLLEESPETAERLGDVPVAVVEKARRLLASSPAPSSTRARCGASSAAA